MLDKSVKPEVGEMSVIKNIIKWLRMGTRRSSPLLKVLLLAMVVFCTVALIVLGVSIHQTKMENQQLLQQAAQLEQDNEELEEKIAGLDTVQGIIRIARQMLGLEDPDAVIIEPVEATDSQ